MNVNIKKVFCWNVNIVMPEEIVLGLIYNQQTLYPEPKIKVTFVNQYLLFMNERILQYLVSHKYI